MTSSVTSTEKGLVPRPPDGPPAKSSGLSPDAARRLALAAFVWLPAFGIVAVMYGASLTVGALFLGLGWVAFAMAAWQIGRAALVFDVEPADTLSLEDKLDDDRRAELRHEKKILLKAIKEIEFDHQMGKIDDRDAAEITATYRGRALEILRLLDESKATDYATIVEKELAKRLAKAGGASKKKELAAPADAPAEAADAPAEVEATLAPGTCAGCGTKNDADAVFCKKCAARLAP